MGFHGESIGAYRIERETARTRTAATYDVTHARLGRPVALRVMLAGPGFRGAQAQFLREAEVLGRLSHPGIARAYERGTLPDGRAWFVTDRAIGPALADVIATGARVDALRVVLELAGILAFAHHAGLAHRNLRADAVRCGADPRGPALRIDDWSQSRELATSPSDATADVHALGVIAFQCLAGVMAFGSGALALQARTSVAERFPRAARPLTGLLDRMLSRDVGARPAIGEVCEVAGMILERQLRDVAVASGEIARATYAHDAPAELAELSPLDDDSGEMTRVERPRQAAY